MKKYKTWSCIFDPIFFLKLNSESLGGRINRCFSAILPINNYHYNNPWTIKVKRPESSTSFVINLIGLFSFLFTLYFLSQFYSEWSSNLRLVIVSISLALPIIILEYFYRRPPLLSSTLFKKAKPTTNKKRIVIKLLALYTIWSIIAFIYWVFPEYRGSFYQTYLYQI